MPNNFLFQLPAYSAQETHEEVLDDFMESVSDEELADMMLAIAYEQVKEDSIVYMGNSYYRFKGCTEDDDYIFEVIFH